MPEKRDIDYFGHAHPCRLVATVHITDGTDEKVWHAYDDSGFYLTGASWTVRRPTHHNTIRQALSQAVKNAGWG